MKKVVSILISMAMAIFMFSGCTQGPSSASKTSSADQNSSISPVTIGWTSWAFAEQTLYPTYKAMADGFMAENKNVTIKMTSQPYAQYLQQLLIAAAAGNAPDVAHVKAEWLPQFTALKCVKPVQSYISSDIRSDYSSDAIKAVTIDKNMIALPWFSNTYALYYNKALLQQAGITALPKTWNELIQDANKISSLGKDKNGNKIYGLAIPSSESETGDGYNIFPALWAHGGNFLDSKGKINLTDKAAIDTFTEVQKLFREGVSPNGADFKELRNLFGQGVVGFMWDLQATIDTCASAAPNKDEFYKNFGCMVIPGNNTAAGSGYLIVHDLMVFNSCSDSKMQTVGKFLDYMSGDKVIQILRDANMGKMSSRASVMKDVYGNVTDDTTKVYVEAMKSARSLPTTGLHFLDADNLLIKSFTALAQGGNVTTVMTNTQKQIQALYDQK